MLSGMKTGAGWQSAGAGYRWGLLLVVAVAALARALGSERVFLEDGSVAFAAGDAFYHARRALYSFHHFPELLLFDPCINYPQGARIPHPPLLDWGTAAFARLFTSSTSGFERIAAWLPVVLGALATLPIASLGRRLRGPFTGLGAATIYALLPICINYGRVGNFDHHAPAGLIGACLLLLYTMALEPDRRGRALFGPMLGLVVARLAMLLCWHGSLLYLLPGEAALVLAGALRRQPDRLIAQGLGSIATAGLALPMAWLLNPPTGDGDAALLASEFSLLHVLIFAAAGLICLLQRFAIERLGIESNRGAALCLVGLGTVTAAGVLAIPGVLSGLLPALSFITATDGYTETVVEQLPIFFAAGELSLGAAHAHMGLYVYLVVGVPFAYAYLIERRAARADPRALFLAVWSLLLGYLAYQQVRYVHDYAPAGCVGFALLLGAAGRRISATGIAAGHGGLIALALGAICLAPAVSLYHAPAAALAWRGLRGALDGSDRALLSIAGTQVRFAQLVHRTTDAVGTCAGPGGGSPEYGVLAHVGLGHVIHHVAERATPADPFGPYIGPGNFAAVARFMQSADEETGFEIARDLNARYVATAAEAIPNPEHSLAARLHADDGSARGARPHLEHFRLITEGPAGGIPMAAIFGAERQSGAPYKLFEIVPGAVLEIQAPPGGRATVELTLRTPTGRQLVHRAVGTAGADGIARVRVPYSSRAQRGGAAMVDRVHPVGLHRVRAGGREWRVRVPEGLIQSGGTLRIPSESPSPQPSNTRFPRRRGAGAP